jgi:hypothetical protein
MIELYEIIERMPIDGWIHGCLFCFSPTSSLKEFKTSETAYEAYVCMQCRKRKQFLKEFPKKCTEMINNLYTEFEYSSISTCSPPPRIDYLSPISTTTLPSTPKRLNFSN